MEIQFLGTSSGTPTKARNVAGLALRPPESSHWYLVDCGEGTQHRILHTSFSLHGLRGIFITHIHGDHCYGLPGLLASAGLLNRSAPLLIAGPPEVRAYVECVMATTALGLPYDLDFVEVEDGAHIDWLPDVVVGAVALSHRVPSYAYTFEEKSVERKLDAARLARDGVPAGPVWGQLQRGEGANLPDGRVLRAEDYLLASRKPRKIIVGGDNDTPQLLAQVAQGADVLVHEATYTEEVLLKIGPEPQHSSAKMVAYFAQEAQVPNLVLTHFSPRYHQSIAEVEAEARVEYGGRLFLASDLDRYILDREGVLARIAPAA
ncbi:MBL fold metallo-hydrolase [Massilia terrae]|uniref:Ribonuclease Z n=1 Tax=Massilia terrae TaxID=1811224 RepID=A0ABT2CTL8_9BURK|nr:MBL fold metallo-hydrolase [Massilia terrae]MCS0657294.1 MBL fold metallo-hydrolase [Massilia terrae]